MFRTTSDGMQGRPFQPPPSVPHVFPYLPRRGTKFSNFSGSECVVVFSLLGCVKMMHTAQRIPIQGCPRSALHCTSCSRCIS